MSEPRQSDISRPVSSNQTGLHSQLATTLQRHLDHPFRRPPAPHSVAAYQALAERLRAQPQPLVIDSFCGTGMSTQLLAQRHPDQLVVGIDQSAHRLQKHLPSPAGNYLLLQAQVEDIWALLLADGYRAQYHYLLYPNPWPKRKHLQRRVHGHGSFPLLLELGGYIELRSNWQLYVEEFGVAMHLAGRRGLIRQISGDPPLTLFEDKYRNSGHRLWAFTAAP
ncbi:SAM-dependent methyltransferase [Seongchinamella unica]|uniref:tRNA (guanine(46)-N(7))-methyltransferase n=1 Tax=Seongchinamella unica TaxID=2547392 RepID=A0A4R5LVU4_9GAMM|nr:SAM-dependent methyltransferase [Seongchinamella unica]TDG15569.1 SAM-dependent methyltransferase [Seongchinamella unica]